MWQWGGDANCSFYKEFERYYDYKDFKMSAKENQATDPLSSVSHEMRNSLLKAKEDYF